MQNKPDNDHCSIRLKVVVVHPSLNKHTGGIVKAGLSYVEGLLAAGHDVKVWTASNIFADGARAAGAKTVLEPSLRSMVSILTSPRVFLKFLNDCSSADGVIHNNGRLWPIARLHRKSNHYVVFHNPSIGSRGHFRRWMPISQAQVEKLEPERTKRPWVKSLDRIRNGISSDAWRPLPEILHRQESRLVIGFLAEIRPQKALEVLLDAAKILEEEGYSFLLRIGGDGQNLQDYKDHASKLGLTSSIEWTGWVPEPSKFFDDIDIFCLPSRREGFPLVLLEAMARRTPVVASRIDGSTELVENSNGGLLFEKDDSKSLAEKLVRLLQDPDLRHNLASNGYSYVSNDFRPTNIGVQLAKVIRAHRSECR